MKKILIGLTSLIISTGIYSCKKEKEAEPEPAPNSPPAALSYKKDGVLITSGFSFFDQTSGVKVYGGAITSSTGLPALNVQSASTLAVGSLSLDLAGTWWLDTDTTFAYAYQGTFDITSVTDGLSGNFSFDGVKTDGATIDTIHITEGVFSNLRPN